MSSPAAEERRLLCDLFDEVGPDCPTRCGEWTTRDLAAHLVVRERRPDAAPGILTSVLADHSERVRIAEAERPYAEIVERVRSGPPMWSPTRPSAVDRLVNTIEFFVQHEDVRRGSGSALARDLSESLDTTLRSLLPTVGKLLTRRAPVGVVLDADGLDVTTLHAGEPTVTIRGPIGECVLFLYGRGDVAHVELDGPSAAIEQLRSADLGI